MDKLFEQAATLARMQAEGYKQVREQARRELAGEIIDIYTSGGADSALDRILDFCKDTLLKDALHA